MAEEDDIRAIVYETDGVYMALCNDFPGITGEGSTREECIEDLTNQIHEKIAQQQEEKSRSALDEIQKRIGPMRRP